MKLTWKIAHLPLVVANDEETNEVKSWKWKQNNRGRLHVAACC